MSRHWKALILDCFGVLYVPVEQDFYQSHIPNYPQQQQKIQDLGQQADLGKISQDEFIMQIAQLAGMNVDQVRAQIVGNLVRNQTLLQFSQSLRPKLKVGLLSNISAGTMDRFFGVREREQLFDAVVLSSEVGMIKPNPEIYKLMTERLNIAPNNCIFVDDSPANCAGAQAVGMQATVYKSTEQVKADISKLIAN